jgi:serine/threonine protein phosphatase PrpC/tetratricopeptide (TPR) repeat protein
MSEPVNQSTNQPKQAVSIHSSAVTDRGLNQKRPLNEDSFLADNERHIFAVADGVGGAEAGEVASQTAIEVLDEAFRHQLDGADIEDLMELAIQRANASIHQMSQEHAKFSMMATTIVALHLEGNVATIGHVGDSRLYRLTPAGQLVRETEDHSVVEEEVRAGRMTAEQAANHPSKNVISRALGAENNVDADMKVIEVEDGTEFLLCTDGITRHIPDHELRQLLIVHDDLTTLCVELKQRCFERGAEDNLTAVVVRVGTAISANQRQEDLEKTISPEDAVPVASVSEVPPARDKLQDTLETPIEPVAAFVPPSRKAFPGPSAKEIEQTTSTATSNESQAQVSNASPPRSGVEKTMARFFLFVLFLGALAGAFYAGKRYKGAIPYLDQTADPTAQASPALRVAEDPWLKFEKARREVDLDPNAWLATGAKNELVRQGIQNPLDSTDPEFLYLYGRASLLSGKYEEAAKAFEAAIIKSDLNPSPANVTLRKEASLGLAAVALKSDKDRAAAQAHFDEITRKSSAPSSVASPPTPSSISPSSSP